MQQGVSVQAPVSKYMPLFEKMVKHNHKALDMVLEAKDNIQKCKTMIGKNQDALRQGYGMMYYTGKDSDLGDEGYVSQASDHQSETPLKRQKK